MHDPANLLTSANVQSGVLRSGGFLTSPSHMHQIGSTYTQAQGLSNALSTNG